MTSITTMRRPRDSGAATSTMYEKEAIVIDVIVVLSGAAAETTIGFLITTFGFAIPSLLNVVLAFVALLYVICLVPETHIPSPGSYFSFRECVTSAWKTFTLKEGNRRPKLMLILCMLLFAQMPLVGSQAISVLYQMNHPLCWGPKLIGIYLAVAMFVIQSGSLFGTLIFRRCLPETYIVAMGDVSGCVAYLVYAWTTTTTMVFVVPIIGMFELLPLPLTRAIGSKLVSPQEQGSLFAGLSVIGSAASLVSSLGFTAVYNQTLHLFPGTTFLVCSACYFIALLFTVSLIVYDRNHRDMSLITVNRGDTSKSE